MAFPSRNIMVLAAGQALTTTVISLLTSVSSLSGAHLAPTPLLSTLPVTATVIGALAMIYPASALMGRLGRRLGFMFKATVGVLGGAICIVALSIGSFALLIVGTFLLGIFSAFGQYYRFAAIDAAKSPQQRASAVATVTGAGVVGGLLGPFLGGHFAWSAPSVPYAGAFAALCVVCIILAGTQSLLSADLGLDAKPASFAAAPKHRFHANTDFLKASMICAIGFSAMTLVMNAAPLSMHRDGHSMHASALVLQTHFVLMYLPSFFNATLVKRIGERGLILAGLAAGAAGCLLAFVTTPSLPLYILELGLSGVTWNFIFNGGTLLLATTYAPDQKTQAQGLNSLFVYACNVVASFSAGGLMATFGWPIVNVVPLPMFILACFALRASGKAKALANPRTA